MILGTCNFGNEYNGSIIKESEISEILRIYQDNEADPILDTATNYGKYNCHCLELIKKNNYNGKLIIKVWNKKNISKALSLFPKIFCLMIRGNDDDLIDYCLDLKESGIIEKIGQSIYYPHELTQRVNITSIPNNNLFKNYLNVLGLYSDIYIRSNFNLINDKIIIPEINYNSKKINIRYIIGIDNKEQLLENIKYAVR